MTTVTDDMAFWVILIVVGFFAGVVTGRCIAGPPAPKCHEELSIMDIRFENYIDGGSDITAYICTDGVAADDNRGPFYRFPCIIFRGEGQCAIKRKVCG